MGNKGVLAALATATLLLAGCGGDESIGMDLYPVTGTVEKGGQPVANVTVFYNAVEGAYAPRGQTDAQGKFELETGGDKGAPAGDYIVTIMGGEDIPDKFRRKPTSTLRQTVAPGGEPHKITLD